MQRGVHRATEFPSRRCNFAPWNKDSVSMEDYSKLLQGVASVSSCFQDDVEGGFGSNAPRKEVESSGGQPSQWTFLYHNTSLICRLFPSIIALCYQPLVFNIIFFCKLLVKCSCYLTRKMVYISVSY